MEFNTYQVITNDTAIYPVDMAFSYLTLGLVGEAGEVANKIKKALRDNGGALSTLEARDVCNELGDCLWYIAQLCEVLGENLNVVALQNIQKLKDRKNRGVLGGSGDNR